MRPKGTAYAGLAVLTAVILAGALVYNYTAATGQISSLNGQVVSLESQTSSLESEGSVVCSAVNSVVNSVSGVYSKTVEMMQQQIQEDNSIIMALNSTKPSGYAGLITALQAQQTQDSSIEGYMVNLTSGPAPSVGPSPCVPFE
jgi:hypothetical protein